MGHHHHHAHGHDHHHHHHHHANRRALTLSLAIVTVFMAVEAIGGWLANSLALLSDAGHMLSDALALLLSLLASRMAERPPSPGKTYGLHRLEILAALANGVTLAGLSLWIVWEAMHRMLNPEEVASGVVIGIALLGLVANVAAAAVLMRGNVRENLNLQSALLHVLGDLLGSIGAVVAGLLMWGFGWYLADPVVSVVIAALVLISAWRVTKESIHILMEGTPSSIDIHQVRESLASLPRVKEVHDLHVWTVTSGFHSLSCHLLVEDDKPSYDLLQQALDVLEQRFHITHATIQIENEAVRHRELDCRPRNGRDSHHNRAH